MNLAAARIIASLLLALVATTGAQAAERRFMPIAVSPAQRIDVVGTTPVVSANAASFGGGAAILPVSTRSSRVLVSVRNLGSKPLAFDAATVTVDSDGRPRPLQAIDSQGHVVKPGKPRASVPRSSGCLNVQQSAYSSCLEMESRRAELERATDASEASDSGPILPGQTRASQYLVDLPRKAGDAPASMTVTVRVSGEALGFEFREVQ